MLTAEENERLTRVGAGTSMGRLMRRYWIPAVLSEEIEKAGGAPVRVPLLGESLVAYRDPDGKVGLIDEACPHRGASLFYARNEPGGLRCLYHGWKMSGDGRVLEAPPEPPGSTFASKLCQKAYPVVEAGGVIWTYMGPAELRPPFPRFTWLDLPREQLLVVKMFQDSNYLQGVEGDLDPAHPNYLHRDFYSDEKSWNGVGWQSINDLMHDGAPVIHCEDTPHMMRVGAIRNSSAPGMSYVRVTEWVAPFYTFIASAPEELKVFKAWLPIDDFTCYTLYVHYDPFKPIDRDAIYNNWNHRGDPASYRTPHTLQNNHLQDRELMERGNYSGIRGAAIQDRAVQESMGPVFDRTREHLGTSDKAVIYYRRYLLARMRDMDEGRPLPGQDASHGWDLQSASVNVPKSTPWQEAARVQMELEQRARSVQGKRQRSPA